MARSSTSRNDPTKGSAFVWLLTLAVVVVVGVLAWLYARPPENLAVNLRLPPSPALPAPAPLPNPTPIPSPLPTPSGSTAG